MGAVKALLACGLAISLSVQAALPEFELHIASLEHEGLVLQQIQLQAQLQQEHGTLIVRVAELKHPELTKPVRDLELHCPKVDWRWPGLRCEQAELILGDSPLGQQKLTLRLDWQDLDNWSAEFNKLRWAGDELRGGITWQAADWQARIEADALDLSQARLPELSEASQLEQLLTELNGVLNGELKIAGQGDQLTRLHTVLQVNGLDYADQAGMQAGQQLSAKLSFNAQRKADDRAWRVAAQLAADQGELFSEPIFVDVKAQPLLLIVDGQWHSEPAQLAVKKALLNLGSEMRLQAEGLMSTSPLRPIDAAVRFDSQDLNASYQTLLQPFLIGTRLDALELVGSAGLHLAWQAGQLSGLDLVLAQLDMADANAQLGAQALRGSVHWRKDSSVPESRLAWSGLQLAGLDVGPADLHFATSGVQANLLAPLRMPFYQGELIVDDAVVLQADERWQGGLSLQAQSVQLSELSQALGWPAMGGTLNSQVPRARLDGGNLIFDGDVTVNAFDGELKLREIRLSELASSAPIMQGALELRDLDLDKLTQTFAFGRIEGGLHGEVTGLRLVGWAPDRFQARFYTPPGDRLPHRISQRALRDLTALGNGVSGAISGSFLRFFEDFSYDRVEIKISQQGSRARIDGAPHPDGGFYLVRGAGLPRIDVIGQNREVAWADLIARLKSIRLEGIQLQ